MACARVLRESSGWRTNILRSICTILRRNKNLNANIFLDGARCTYVLRVQYSCGVVLVFWFWREIVFGVTCVLSVQYRFMYHGSD